MNRLTKMLVVFFAAMVCVSMAAGPSHAKIYKGLFLYWRGETPCGAGFKEGLKNLGYEIAAVEYNANRNKDNLDNYLAAVKESDFDFVYTFSTTVGVEASKYIKNTPIFFGVVTDPVKAGMVKSWESSGNNVTGISHNVPFPDQVDFILKVGKFKRIAVIYNLLEANSVIAIEELQSRLGPKGIKVQAYPACEVRQIKDTIADIIEFKPDLVYLPSDTFILVNGDTIIPAFTAAKLPTYGALEKYLDSQGAMVGIVCSYRSVGLELANSAAQVFQGKRPTDVPCKTLPPNMQTIKVNPKTAQQVGFKIPKEIMSSAQIIQ